MKTFLFSLLVFIVFAPYRVLAQWSTPVNISPLAMNASMNENMGPCIAVSHDTIHVIWSDKRTKGSAIYYTRSIDSGHTWSTAVAITDTMGKASMPSIAVNGRNIHVVWWDSLNEVTHFTTNGNSSFYLHSTNGGNSWSTKVCIDSVTLFWPGVSVSGSTVLVSLNKGGFDSTSVWLTKSTDNGNSWGTEQMVSTRVGQGRSEDQAIATDGKYIHLSWNDNRSGTMEIYYRRSRDMGQTWDPEVAMTDINSYTTMISLDSSHVDIAHGVDSTYYNSWVRQSSDSGGKWNPDEQVTTNTISNDDQIYPFLIRNGLNLHMVSFDIGLWREYYSYSADGGVTWAPEVFLGTGHGSPFIALTCPVLHVIWPNSGIIYYTRNSTGNPSCNSVSGFVNNKHLNTSFLLYPNPVENTAIISFEEGGIHKVELDDVTGRKVLGFTCPAKEYSFSCNGLSAGLYFIKVTNDKDFKIVKFIKQ